MNKLYSIQQIKGRNTKAIVTIPGWVENLEAGEDVSTSSEAFSRVSLVFRALNLRCDSLVKPPIRIYENDKEVKDIERFFPGVDLIDLIWRTEASLLLTGAGFWLRLKNKVKYSGLQWLNPYSMIVKRDEQTNEISFIQENAFPRGGPWGEDRVIYFRDFNPTDDVGPGVSPVEVSLVDAQLLRYMPRFAAVYFKEGAMPATIVGIDGLADENERKRIDGWFKKQVTGIRNAFRSLVLGTNGITFQTLTPRMKDLATPDLKAQAIQDVAHAFGIPQTMLTDAANYATAKEHRESFWSDTIQPRGTKFERIINTKYLQPLFGKNVRIHFAFEELDIFQEDEESRSASFYNYVQAGMKRSVAAQILGIELPEGMEYPTLDEVEDQSTNQDDTNTDQDNDDLALDDGSPRKALVEELKTWERFVIKNFKKDRTLPKRSFTSEVIPSTLYSAINGALTMAKSVEAIKGIFADALRWEKYP